MIHTNKAWSPSKNVVFLSSKNTCCYVPLRMNHCAGAPQKVKRDNALNWLVQIKKPIKRSVILTHTFNPATVGEDSSRTGSAVSLYLIKASTTAALGEVLLTGQESWKAA